MGVGLAYVKEMVERLNGNIEVNSQQGKGTEFILYLPIKNKAQITSTDESQLSVEQKSQLVTNNEHALDSEAIKNRFIVFSCRR